MFKEYINSYLEAPYTQEGGMTFGFELESISADIKEKWIKDTFKQITGKKLTWEPDSSVDNPSEHWFLTNNKEYNAAIREVEEYMDFLNFYKVREFKTPVLPLTPESIAQSMKFLKTIFNDIMPLSSIVSKMTLRYFKNEIINMEKDIKETLKNKYAHKPSMINYQKEIEKKKQILETIQKVNIPTILTNESCGFHVHFGFSHTSNILKNIKWIHFQILFTEKYNERFKPFLEFGNIAFWNSLFAEKNNKLHSIKKVKTKNDLNDLINENKTLMFGDRNVILHMSDEYGTMEWRGPRGFLDNREETLQNISTFFRKYLYPLGNLFAEMSDQSHVTINNVTISKKEFFQIININNNQFDSKETDDERINKMRGLDIKPKNTGYLDIISMFKNANQIKEDAISFIKDHPSILNKITSRDYYRGRILQKSFIFNSDKFKNLNKFKTFVFEDLKIEDANLDNPEFAYQANDVILNSCKISNLHVSDHYGRVNECKIENLCFDFTTVGELNRAVLKFYDNKINNAYFLKKFKDSRIIETLKFNNKIKHAYFI